MKGKQRIEVLRMGDYGIEEREENNRVDREMAKGSCNHGIFK